MSFQFKNILVHFGLTLLLVGKCFAMISVGAENFPKNTSPAKKSVAILLNGTSSAGKTTVAQALIPLLEESSDIVSQDEMYLELLWQAICQDTTLLESIRQKFVAEYGRSHKSEDEFCEYVGILHERGSLDKKLNWDDVGQHVYAKMCTSYLTGKNVIGDMVITSKDGIECLSKNLRDIPAFKVMVYCPLEELFQHLIKRNQSKNERDHRQLDLPFLVFFALYKKQEANDPIVDVLKKDTINSVVWQIQEIAKKTETDPVKLALFLQKIDSQKQKIFETLGLNDHEEVAIASKFPYDFIVNAGLFTADECARQIMDAVKKFQSQLSIKEINCIQEANMVFEQANKDDLFVFDIDGVIFESIEPMMQYGLYLNNPELRKIFDDFNAFILTKENPEEYRKIIASKIRLKSKNQPVEKALISNILNLQKRNIKIIALTAFKTGEFGLIEHLEDWRYKDLVNLGLDFSLSFEQQKILFDELAATEYHSKYKIANGDEPSPAMFYNGVVCTSCYPKGIVLKAFIEKIGWRPNRIYFFDDQVKNTESVVQEMSKLKIKCQAFVYKAAIFNWPKDDIDIEVVRFQHELIKQNNDFVSYIEAKQLLTQIKSQYKESLLPVRAKPYWCINT